jgi:hypothetical protein
MTQPTARPMRGETMKLTEMQSIVLGHLIAAGHIDVRKISEPHRQRFIDLAMMEPPLVDIDAGRIYATAAGIARAQSEKR